MMAADLVGLYVYWASVRLITVCCECCSESWTAGIESVELSGGTTVYSRVNNRKGSKKNITKSQAAIVARLISTAAAHSHAEGSTPTRLVQSSNSLTSDVDYHF